MRIGKATGPESAHVHSPVPGIVAEVREIYLAGGRKSVAVVIDLAGEFDRLGKEVVTHEWRRLPVSRLLEDVTDRGVVGMGGLGTPAGFKLRQRKGHRWRALIVNGAESEPYRTSDHRLMVEHPNEVLEGIEIAAAILSPDQVTIGIEANKSDAVSAISRAVKHRELPFRVAKLSVRYPQGEERQMVRALTDSDFPPDRSPETVGIMVCNVATLYAIYEAVALHKPLVERVVTVAGGAIRKPQNLKVRIGTPVGRLLEECGGFSQTPAKIVCGGPMTGQAVYDPETPVIKTTGCVLALTRGEVHDAKTTACIQCGRCIRACPVGIEPVTLYKLIDHGRIDEASAEGLFECCECAACSYTCPSRIPLVEGLKVGKKLVRESA
jgi:electron transport complex protein RnfC